MNCYAPNATSKFRILRVHDDLISSDLVRLEHPIVLVHKLRVDANVEIRV